MKHRWIREAALVGAMCILGLALLSPNALTQTTVHRVTEIYDFMRGMKIGGTTLHMPVEVAEIATEAGASAATATKLNLKSFGFLTGAATYDAPSLSDGVGTTIALTVTGAALGDYCLPSIGVDAQGITLTGAVSASNVCSVRLQNESGGTLDLASTTLRAVVIPQ